MDKYGNTFTSFSGSKTLTFSGLANSASGSVPTVNNGGTAVNQGTAETMSFTAGVSGTASSEGILLAYDAQGPVTLNVTDNASTPLTSTSAGGTGVSLTVMAAPATKLVFTSAAYTGASALTAGVASGNITVQREDQYGNTNTTDAARTVTLTSTSSGTVTFTPASPLTIAQGSGSATFTYTDTKSGSPTITAASTSPTTITLATQVETVNAAGAFQLGFVQQPTTAGEAPAVSHRR